MIVPTIHFHASDGALSALALRWKWIKPGCGQWLEWVYWIWRIGRSFISQRSGSAASCSKCVPARWFHSRASDTGFPR